MDTEGEHFITPAIVDVQGTLRYTEYKFTEVITGNAELYFQCEHNTLEDKDMTMIHTCTSVYTQHRMVKQVISTYRRKQKVLVSNDNVVYAKYMRKDYESNPYINKYIRRKLHNNTSPRRLVFLLTSF